MKTSKKTRNAKPITADEFDQKFENDEDVSEHVDWSDAQKFISIPIPVWMINSLDEEAKRLGINRQALIKVWLADCIERVKGKKASGL
jgi:hypothetical protein